MSADLGPPYVLDAAQSLDVDQAVDRLRKDLGDAALDLMSLPWADMRLGWTKATLIDARPTVSANLVLRGPTALAVRSELRAFVPDDGSASFEELQQMLGRAAPSVAR